MTKPVYLLLAAATLLVSACSSTPACTEHQAYMDAKAFPPLKGGLGLKAPKPNPNMQIPKVANGPIGQYQTAPAHTDPDNPAARCLITPPPMSTSRAAS